VTLFDPGPSDPPVKLSEDRRRTLKRLQLLERGIHPATKRPVWAEHVCGTCTFHVVRSRSQSWHKCTKAGLSSSAATDIRVSWPACDLWEADAGKVAP
jgi:hypothetical protein